jgi:hypothetical protein
LQKTCLPWLEKELATKTKTIEDLRASNSTLETENARLCTVLPPLTETARWFNHFLPNIDIHALTSLSQVGRAQEVATHSLLQTLFGEQFYAIDIVSDGGHQGDIRIQPEQDGPTVLVEVKTYLPTSKGVVRNGKRVHVVQSIRGRQKLIADLEQNRPHGCLAGVLVIHPDQHIPSIDMGDGNSIIVDPEHPHLFYVKLSTLLLHRTILAAVLCAYTRWGAKQNKSWTLTT